MDAVYICRAGENEELRYSLRSIAANMPHGRVVVFGAPPAWYTGRCVRIEQVHGKQRNVTEAVKAACTDPDVSDPFVLLNDDFFALEPVEVRLYDRGPLADVLAAQAASHPKSLWTARMRATRDYLTACGHSRPLSYELHVPMPVRKAELLQAVTAAENTRGGLQWRTVYGAMCGDESTTMCDVKVLPGKEAPSSIGPWLSTADATFHSMLPMLARLFPDASPYEEVNMTKVRTLRKFRDTTAQVTRNPGDEFEVTPERAAFLADHERYGALVEILDQPAAETPAPATVKDIKAILDARGIEYRANAKKDDLLALL